MDEPGAALDADTVLEAGTALRTGTASKAVAGNNEDSSSWGSLEADHFNDELNGRHPHVVFSKRANFLESPRTLTTKVSLGCRAEIQIWFAGLCFLVVRSLDTAITASVRFDAVSTALYAVFAVVGGLFAFFAGCFYHVIGHRFIFYLTGFGFALTLAIDRAAPTGALILFIVAGCFWAMSVAFINCLGPAVASCYADREHRFLAISYLRVCSNLGFLLRPLLHNRKQQNDPSIASTIAGAVNLLASCSMMLLCTDPERVYRWTFLDDGNGHREGVRVPLLVTNQKSFAEGLQHSWLLPPSQRAFLWMTPLFLLPSLGQAYFQVSMEVHYIIEGNLSLAASLAYAFSPFLAFLVLEPRRLLRLLKKAFIHLHCSSPSATPPTSVAATRSSTPSADAATSASVEELSVASKQQRVRRVRHDQADHHVTFFNADGAPTELHPFKEALGNMAADMLKVSPNDSGQLLKPCYVLVDEHLYISEYVPVTLRYIILLFVLNVLSVVLLARIRTILPRREGCVVSLLLCCVAASSALADTIRVYILGFYCSNHFSSTIYYSCYMNFFQLLGQVAGWTFCYQEEWLLKFPLLGLFPLSLIASLCAWRSLVLTRKEDTVIPQGRPNYLFVADGKNPLTPDYFPHEGVDGSPAKSPFGTPATAEPHETDSAFEEDGSEGTKEGADEQSDSKSTHEKLVQLCLITRSVGDGQVLAKSHIQTPIRRCQLAIGTSPYAGGAESWSPSNKENQRAFEIVFLPPRRSRPNIHTDTHSDTNQEVEAVAKVAPEVAPP